MRRILLLVALLMGVSSASYGQTTIKFQSFESGSDDWSYTASPAFGTFTSSGDEWNIVTSYGTLDAMPTDGSNFVAGDDLNNGDNPNSTFVTLDFDAVSVSGYTGIEVSFDYDINGYDNGDKLEYELTIDGVDQGTILVAGGTGTTVDGTVTASIPNGSSTVALLVTITQNGSDDIGLDNFKVTGTSSGGTPTKLAVTSINGGNSPSISTGFDVIIQVQDNSDTPTTVSSDTDVTLTLATGTGTLGGTLTGTISSGTNSVTISGVTYNTAESGVSITVSDDASGLTAGTSSTFEVLSAADQLVLVDVPSTGSANSELSSFTVEARRSGDNSVDLNYTKTITVSKVSGSGNIGGTTSVSASAGVSTFSDITFDADDSYSIQATDGSLLSSTSSTILLESPDYTETFTNFPETGGSYNDGTFEGTAGNTWTYVAARGDQQIDGATPGLRNSTTASLSTTLSGGISSFSFDYKQLFSTNVNLEVYINEDLVSTVTSSSETGVTKGSGDISVNYIGEFTIEFKQGTGGGQVGIDNFSWFDKDSGKVSITGDAGWRLLSLPITGGTVESISDDTPVQGVTGGDNSGADANFIIYDSDATFEQPTNVSTAWGDGLGFGLYFYDNTTAGSSELPVTLDASGSEPSSDVTVTLNPAASGYTLVGNPFASNFDLNTMTATSSNISSNVAFWNDGTGTYSTQSISSSYIVAPWQGFWVQTSSAAATSLTIPTSGKTTSSTTGTFFSKTVAYSGDINFTLTSESTYDEAIRMSFRESATTGYDRDDFGKLMPLLPAYSTMAFVDGERLKSVESLPYGLNEEVTIELEHQVVGVSGEFTLAWSGMETIPSDWSVTLYDYETGSSVDLRAEGEYTFTAGSASKAKDNALTILAGPAPVEAQASGSSRFGIVINPGIINSNEEDATPQAFSLEQNYPNPFNPATTIEYSVDKAGAVNLSVYNLMGQKVAELVNEAKSAGSYKVQWNAASAASGMYYYRLEANGASITRKMTLIK